MSHIKLSVPNDDSCALFHIGKSLIELSATIDGSPQWVIITQKAYDELQALKEATHVITSQEKIGEPVWMGDGNFSQGYRIEVEELVKQAEVDTTAQQVESLAIPVEANGATYETDLGSDNPQAIPLADSTGTPWDDRIHSASKALNGDGTWRVRRKPADKTPEEWAEYIKWVEEDIHLVESLRPDDEDMGEAIGAAITEVHGALAEQYGQGLANAAFTGDHTKAPEPAITPQGDDFHVDAGEVTEQEVASIPAPPPPPVVAVSESTAPLGHEYAHYTFPQVMQFLTERHGRITSPQVDQIIADMGLNSIMDIRDNPEHAGPFIARVKALLGE
jgi:hypothetical protein